jgi:hypothetical protein
MLSLIDVECHIQVLYAECQYAECRRAKWCVAPKLQSLEKKLIKCFVENSRLVATNVQRFYTFTLDKGNWVIGTALLCQVCRVKVLL